MKIPASPPDCRRIADQSEGFFRIFEACEPEATRIDRYLHWEELRYREAPPGLTHEQWWSGLKLRRIANQRPLPLLDLGGKPFVFSLTPGMFERLHRIDLKCGGAIEGPREVTDPETRDRYWLSSLTEEAITSSLIEGAAVTRFDAKEMIRSQRKPVTRGERMILNNYLTMRKLSDWKDAEMTPELLLDVHRSIARDNLDDPEFEGRFRRAGDPVRVEDETSGEVLHDPPRADQLRERIDSFCEFANETEMRGFLHPVLRSILLHFWIAYEHPFVDGNGRTARAVFYWSMLRHGFWLFEFISISQQILRAPAKYYRAFLQTETDGNDLNYFLNHQLGVIEDSVTDLHRYLDRKKSELHEVRRLLTPDSTFNHRQLALIRHALTHPQARYTVASHANSHGVVAQTARTDLRELADPAIGLLRESRRGRASVFTPTADIAEKVRSRSSFPEG